jgi:tetratricopeptide (TPR) repeat protein
VVVLGLSSILLALGVAGTTWGVLRTQAARRDAAQREAEAEAGLQFLTSVLRAADPWRSGGMINARQIVDQASRVISGEVADFPEVQARLMVALGKTYSSLGLPEEARKHLNDALTTQRRLLGDAHPETIESMVQIGNAEVIASNFAEAQAVGERAVAACLGTFGELSQQTRDAMNVVGDALAGLGRMEEAIELRARMYAMADKELGKDSPKTLWQANRLGMLYAEAGRYRDAEELLERVRAAREQVLTASHHSTLRTMYFLAAARRALGRYQEAATLFEQTLLGQRRVLWADHPDTLACAEELAQCWAMLGRLDEACRLQEETLDLYRKAVRDEHERTLAARRALALLHLKAGRWTLANELTEDVLAISRQAMGESHPATHWAMRDRAEVLLAANPPEPQLLQEALDLAQRACSAQEDLRRPDLHKFLVTLAGAQFKTGDIPAAAETLRRAIALAPRDGPLKVDYEGRLGSYEAELGGKTRDPAAPNAVRED